VKRQRCPSKPGIIIRKPAIASRKIGFTYARRAHWFPPGAIANEFGKVQDSRTRRSGTINLASNPINHSSHTINLDSNPINHSSHTINLASNPINHSSHHENHRGRELPDGHHAEQPDVRLKLVPEPANVQPVCDDVAKKIHHSHCSYRCRVLASRAK
jgi:hypothetical protein